MINDSAKVCLKALWRLGYCEYDEKRAHTSLNVTVGKTMDPSNHPTVGAKLITPPPFSQLRAHPLHPFYPTKLCSGRWQ